MHIEFETKKLQKLLECDDSLRRKHGDKISRNIRIRMALFRLVDNLSLVPYQPPERRHLLEGEYKGCFAVNVGKKTRIVFKPAGDFCVKESQIELRTVVSIKIIEVVDYHE